jgi:Na+/H+ antiporter NhaD/arsenite permease-like protein
MRRFPRRWVSTCLALVIPASAAMAEGEHNVVPVSPWMILPFGLLLFGIAVVPFVNRHWWEKNYPIIAGALGFVTIVYYLAILRNGGRILDVGMEYISFICLIGSLFVVSGGIHIRIKGKSTPLANVFLLGIGAVVSNFVGTTGASMILIRPFIRVNRYRIRPYHVVFFIFIVSNMGGALTPIGDPPLFLGYLEGIPFFWVLDQVWFKWLVAMIMIFTVFYLIDRRSFLSLPASTRHGAEGSEEEGEVSGLQNIVYLALILVAVFITDPPFLREVFMVIAAAGSYFTTRKEIHKKNDFNFAPIQEVAILFAGIFATMIPALDWLELNAGTIGIRTPGQFFWGCGILSSFLDNAPTYLNFLSAQIGLLVSPDIVHQVQHLVETHGADIATISGAHAIEIRNTFDSLLRYHYDLVAGGSVPVDVITTACLLGNHPIFVQAISLGAVFFGACTYIGNGPNFMVKSIAEQSGAHCPSFFGYVLRYTFPVLIPVFALIWVLFFAGLI